MRVLPATASARAAVLGVAVVVAALSGLVVLSLATKWWIFLPILLFGAIATVPALGRVVLQLACAVVVALLALISVALLVRLVWSALPFDLPIPVGLVLALAVFGGVAYWYLRGHWAWEAPLRIEVPSPDWSRKKSGWAAGGLAVAVILGLPLGVGLRKRGEERIAAAGEVLSNLDVLIVAAPPPAGKAPDLPSDGTLRRVAGPYTHADDFDLRYSVGFAEGVGVRWTRTGIEGEAGAIAALAEPDATPDAPPAPVNDADRVLLLVVDGTPPVVANPAERESLPGRRGEVGRWRRIARAAAPGGTATYALLETQKRRRLRDWTAFIRPGTHVRRGGTVSVQTLASRSLPDAAARLALASPSAQEDFALALRHRPILRFDRGEPVPRPLSVESLFAEDKVQQCFSDEVLESECKPVSRPRMLENGRTHLQLKLPGTDRLRALAHEEERQLANADTLGEGPAPPPALTPPPLVRRPGSRPLGEGSAIYVHAVPVDNERSRLV